jgi:hypothetical protein
MINIYCYSYPAAMREFAKKGYILAKIGDSHREVDIRIAEQGGASEWEGKVKIGEWNDVKKIDRDFRLHEVLTERGLWHKSDNAGNEWFKIPAKNAADVRKYVDELIATFEGERVRPSVKLRKIQSHNLDKAMSIIADSGKDTASLIANLCPRFGKTIWALSLFNRITKKYGNKVMLLPAYWLSVHSSFESELDRFKDFQDIRYIDTNEPEAYNTAWAYLKEGKRIIIPISLHGGLEEFKEKHEWIANIPNEEVFMFADEGDFGTHAENQVAKLDFLFNN